MKFNWGYKILFVYLAFVAGILFLGIKSSMLKFDLVQKDYYAEELKYQNVIDASARAKAAGGTLILTAEKGLLKIQLPSSFNGVASKGRAHLYYAADEKKDLIKDFSTLNSLINLELLTTTKGNYTLKLDVEKQGVKYYFEQKIFL